jgi:hypothetical protein
MSLESNERSEFKVGMLVLFPVIVVQDVCVIHAVVLPARLGN